MSAVMPAPKSSRWPLVILLALAAGGILWFLRLKLRFYTDFSLEGYSPYFWPRRAGMIPHVFGGLVAISAGLAQIWLGLTHRTGKLHKVLGKVYASGVLVGVFGGFYLAFTIPGNRFAYQSGLFFLCVAWALTTGMALWSIRNRRFDQHRDWMLRSYVVTFAFVTFRLFADWMNSLSATNPAFRDGQIEAVMGWACWAVPLLIAEPLIQLRAVKRR